MLNINVQQEIAAATMRLNLPELTDSELVALLKPAEQHNPATGFHVDCAASCAIRTEMRNRQIRNRELAEA